MITTSTRETALGGRNFLSTSFISGVLTMLRTQMAINKHLGINVQPGSLASHSLWFSHLDLGEALGTSLSLQLFTFPPSPVPWSWPGAQSWA